MLFQIRTGCINILQINFMLQGIKLQGFLISAPDWLSASTPPFPPASPPPLPQRIRQTGYCGVGCTSHVAQEAILAMATRQAALCSSHGIDKVKTVQTAVNFGKYSNSKFSQNTTNLLSINPYPACAHYSGRSY